MKTLATAIAVIGGVTMMAGTAAAQTPAQCDYQARQYANTYASPAGNCVRGAVAGGLFGAIVGSVTGSNVGESALVGAGVGCGVRLIVGSPQWNAVYNQHYNACMTRYVAQPAPPVQACPALIPPQGIDDGYVVGAAPWIQACDLKYRTFNPATWLFNGYDGCQHYCNL